MPKSISEFKDSTVFKLIKLVKCQPCIWNQKYDKYNDRCCVALGWRDITESMIDSGLTEDVLRQKWRNVRDTFRREFKKCPCKTPEDYTGRWTYFKSLFFLAEESTNVDAEQEKDCEKPLDETECQIKIESADENESLDFDTHDVEEVNTITQKETSNDYDLMFLKSLVPYFTHLDPTRKLVLRNKLQNILLQELSDQARCNDS